MIKTNILIVGSGCSALYFALNIKGGKKMCLITKEGLEDSDSYLAQGGICCLKDPSDYETYFEDTLRAGHYENDKKAVQIMIESSADTIKDLIDCGVSFDRKEDGSLSYTREGAHRENRILHHKDNSGEEITSKLLMQAKKNPDLKIYENTSMVDLIEDGKECQGLVIRDREGNIEEIFSDYTILATGGLGGLFKHSTNFPQIKGDGLALALRHGIEVKDISYIQIHPTTLYTKNEGRSFLISESVRGEGALLYGKDGKRFCDELLPRDLLSQAILKQMEKDKTPYVWEDLRPLGEKEIMNHFPNIFERCLEEGLDVRRDLIPVVPAQHYFMGGIKVNYSSLTSLDRLYAIGECACNGVHGKNRLASNSLLESLVFAKRAAQDINENYREIVLPNNIEEKISLDSYDDLEKYKNDMRKNLVSEINTASKEPISAQFEDKYF